MRDWLNSILGQEGGRIAQFGLALLAVILLILLLAWVVRRLQPGGALQVPQSSKSRRRLGVLEASDVDARRRLVLVRRDDVEHLVMIGGPNDLLIESRILRHASAPGATAAARPNLQQMPRPSTAPTGPSLPVTGPSGATQIEPQAQLTSAPPSLTDRPTPAMVAAAQPLEPTMRPSPTPLRRPPADVDVAPSPPTGQDMTQLATPSSMAPGRIAQGPAGQAPAGQGPTGQAPTGQGMAAPGMTSSPPTAPVPVSAQASTSAFAPAPPPQGGQMMPPPPPMPGASSAAMPASPASGPVPPSMTSEARRPSLGDILSAAAAAKATDARDVPQPVPVTPPPPPRSLRAPLPDLEEDDREVPTQIVPHRPAAPQPVIFPNSAPQPPQQTVAATPGPASGQPRPLPKMEPPAAIPDVATQIERAFADFNAPEPPRGMPEASRSATETVRIEAVRVESVRTESRPDLARPEIARPDAARSEGLRSEPQRDEAIVTQPLRRPAPMLERAPAAPPVQPAAREDISPPPIVAPVTTREPVTAPRPSAPPLTAAPAPLAPRPVAVEERPRNQDEELEEEMAKLLSELGGPNTR